MRSILSRGKFCLLLPMLLCFACGGGGGGGVTTLAELQSEIVIPNPGETATVLLEVKSDGTINWAGAVPTNIVGIVTGLTLNRASDASVLVDLLGAGAFDPLTGTTSGTVTITAAEAADLAANPADFLATLLTSTKPPASGGFVAFTAVEWHTQLLGSNEVPTAPDAQGAASFRVTSPTTINFVIAMVQPVQADVIDAHIHVGLPGVPGSIVLNLGVATATRDVAAGTISGTVDVDGETLARILADFSGFYCNVHTLAAPTGAARGQLEMGTVEMSVAMLGSAETPTVVEAAARGGATLEFESTTSGHEILSLQSGTEDVGDIISAHIHVGEAGTPGAILVNLMGPDFSASVSSNSAESVISYTQKDFARILANPAGFYANIHTTLAPNGLVRGQLSTDPRTVSAILSGAEETTPVAGTSGTMKIVFTGVHSCQYTITMTSPAASAITQAHLHDGPAGQNGVPLIDLFLSGDASINGNTITGTAEVPGRTTARVIAGTPGGSALAGVDLPSIFYGNVHTLANPNGAARGQFTQSSLAEPPAGLAYTTPVTYVTGATIAPNSPTSTGGAITHYSISPALSAGLGINATSGIIFGSPTATRVATDYTVTASNSAGSTTATVNITVNVGPPLTLFYTTPVTYVVNTAITPNTPFSTGGAISNYSVNPALPANLALNPSTGVITGTPAGAQAQTTYTVTGTNAAPGPGVQAQIKITITLSLQPPSNLSYSTPVDYPTGYAITDNVPTVSGGTVASWSVSPSLPSGLTFDTSTGKISGTPDTVTAGANYTVTAQNAAGSTQATVNITISLGKPGPFTYSPSSGLGYASPPYAIGTMTPTHTGGGPVFATNGYSISPALPNGISINTTTGVISGTPTQTSPSTTYTITASNATGSTTTTVTISVPY